MKKKFNIYIPYKKKSLKLPLYLSLIKAGFPSPADDYLEKKIDLNEELIKNPSSTFFIKVEGDSMIDANILSGDILIIDRSIEVVDKKIILAIINQEFTVKRLKIINKEIFLMAENENYRPIKVQSSDFEVFGVVSYIIHKAN
jgi:DNA polymerase V